MQKIGNKIVVYQGTLMVHRDEPIFLEFEISGSTFATEITFTNHSQKQPRFKYQQQGSKITLEGWASCSGVMTPYDKIIARSGETEIGFSAHGSAFGDHIVFSYQFTENKIGAGHE